MLQVYKEKEDGVQGSGDVTKVMDRIFKVMYATMEDDITVDDEGNLLGDILGDITVESSIDRSTLLSFKAQDELLGEEEDDIESALVEDEVNAPEEKSLVNQFSEDSDDLGDLDDDELLTSGFDDEHVVAKFDEPVVVIDNGELREFVAVVHDDDDFSDEDLLA